MSKIIHATADQIATVCFRGNRTSYESWRNHQHRRSGVGAYSEQHDTCVYPLGHGRWKLVTKHVDGVTGEAATAAAIALASEQVAA